MPDTAAAPGCPLRQSVQEAALVRRLLLPDLPERSEVCREILAIFADKTMQDLPVLRLLN